MPTGNGQNPGRASTPVPEPVERETTDRLVGDVLTAGQNLGVAGDSPEEIIRKTLTTFVTQVRNGGNGGNGLPPSSVLPNHPIMRTVIKYVLGALFTLAVAYGGMRLAVGHNADAIEANTVDDKVHKEKPAHDGAATKVEVKAVEDKVQTIDKSVIQLGTQINEQEKRQTERHIDIKGELRFLRRQRNRRDD